MQPTASQPQSGEGKNKSLFSRFLDTVEYLGNFSILSHYLPFFVSLSSLLLALQDFLLSVVDPRPEGAKDARQTASFM